MNKSQLIDALAARYEGNRKAAAHALESVLDTITREVARGEKVAITGFGSFEKKVRDARWVRNPSTGARMKAKKKAVPNFKAGAQLKDVVSGAKKLPKLTLAAVDKATPAVAKSAGAKTAAAAKKATSKSTASKSTARSHSQEGTGEEGTGEEGLDREEVFAGQVDRLEVDCQEGTGQEGTGEEDLDREEVLAGQVDRLEVDCQEGTGQEGRPAKKSSPAKSTASKSTAKKAPAKKAPAKKS